MSPDRARFCIGSPILVQVISEPVADEQLTTGDATTYVPDVIGSVSDDSPQSLRFHRARTAIVGARKSNT